MDDRKKNIYNMREIGSERLHPTLQALKNSIGSKEWEQVLEVYNGAIKAAEECRLTGRNSVTDSYFMVADAMPPYPYDSDHEKQAAFLSVNNSFWDLMDEEVVNAINSRCQCARRIT